MTGIAARYEWFAAEVAAIGSPLYADLATYVAGSRDMHAFLETLPEPRQQPNLFFAATRAVAGLPDDGGDLARRVAAHGSAIRHLMETRTTQTNEAGRCATLMTALAGIDGPVALLEVGCSAGLCLLPDIYGYDFGAVQLAGEEGAPVLTPQVNAATPLPARHPDVVWRAGLDLSPLSVDTPEDLAWLRTLIFPGHEDRAARLEQAATCLARHRPRLVEGNLLTDLEALARQAPPDARLVIFHTAVLCYVEPADRPRFTRQVADLGAMWVSNESPGIFPEIAAKGPVVPDAGKFLMAIDGEPVAWTDPHGRSIDWFGSLTGRTG